MLRRITLPSLLYAILVALSAASASAQTNTPATNKLDQAVKARAALVTGKTPVIVSAADADQITELDKAIRQAGGAPGRRLGIINSQAALVPNAALKGLANNPHVKRISHDRTIAGSMERTGLTVGSTSVRQQYGYDGSGVGVAVIDSGITSWHDDLATSTLGVQRVVRFVDFVANQTTPYDDYGHGTHVAGIIGGNGYDSNGRRAGIAPGASLIALKALDGSGNGVISDVIAALDYVVAHKSELNIRVVNLSVATGVYESYDMDPLTRAARAAVKTGIVVVAAAGNNGKSPKGTLQYGGITSPGNEPSVLTVGASSHMGTIDRADDTMAAFSSRGPSAIDTGAKPDVVAPGVGIESTAVANSKLYTSYPQALLNGTVSTTSMPYLSMSGTSMAAPVVAGTVALMLQANPSLTPNAVKAIIQYTAEPNAGYDPLSEGAGFLNAKGAVDLALYFAAPSATAYPTASNWSMGILWGNRMFQGGQLTAKANAWSVDVQWGAAATSTGQTINWGVTTNGSSSNLWDKTGPSRNVVWGNKCSGGDCAGGGWSISSVNDGDVVVWGTGGGGDVVVWGTSDGDVVVWGTGNGGDMVVWGTSCGDSSCAPFIWN